MSVPGGTNDLYVDRAVIDRDAGTHGGGEGHLAEVDTFSGGRLGLFQVSQQRFQIFFDGVNIERNLPIPPWMMPFLSVRKRI